jgi:hypothetical protein
MKDETLVRLIQDACQKLERVNFPVTTPNLIPVYNALLTAAKANHPGHAYLSILPVLAEGETSPEEMRVLLGQLRIVLEALPEENANRPTAQPAAVPTAPAAAPSSLDR